MKIFYKRPLSLILCVMLGSFVFFSFYDNTAIRVIFVSILLSALALSFIPKAKQFFNAAFFRAAILSALIASLLSFCYFDIWFKAYNRYDGEVVISATVEKIESYTYNSGVYLKTEDIEGASFSSYRLIAYIDKQMCEDLSVGANIVLKGEIESFSSNGSFDAESYYTSCGISGIIDEVSSISLKEYTEPSLTNKLSGIREKICKRIISLSDEDTGGLLCALLLGERNYLPNGTKLDFSRIGISHILALSGMHLSILAIGFDKLLRFFGLGKKPSTIFTVFFTLTYMALTGFSVSVVRAGIMMIISSLLFLLSRTRDSLTSLFIAVSFICIIEPYSIFDLSLWLSAFATFGIVVLGEYRSEKYRKSSFIKWISDSFLTSIFAIAATFAITTLKFDTVSILAPLSTLIFSLLTQMFIYLGLLLIVFGGILPIKYLTIPLGKAIIGLSDCLSNFNLATASTNFVIIKIFSVIFTVLFFAFFLFEIKHKRLAIISLSSLLVIILSSSLALTYTVESSTKITYKSVSDERIIITDDSEISVIDISSYKKSDSYDLYEEVAKENLTRIDKYVLTHYSYTLREATETLASLILIREIFIPTPRSINEELILFEIKELTDKSGIKLSVYENEDVISVGDASVIPLYTYKLGETKKNMLTVLFGGCFYTYLGVDMLDGETKNMALEVIDGSHTIILGRHESKNNEYKFTYEPKMAKTLIFSSDRIVLNIGDEKYFENRKIYFMPKSVIIR